MFDIEPSRIEERLCANPDLVFEAALQLRFSRVQIVLLRDFSAEWIGALTYLDRNNSVKYERELMNEQAYELAKRTYRLGMFVLGELHKRMEVLLAGDQAEEELGYKAEMSLADCYFVPAYLQDYGEMHPERKAECRAAAERLTTRMAEGGTMEARTAVLTLLMQHYIRYMHLYA